ncbi:MAG: hypothetical protein ACRBG0_13645 [Lewinella sp.]|uniref:hypothetical protein n=1 Tax=Lewinella sp. TaxID=2004506 RepID=UPI003D6A9526
MASQNSTPSTRDTSKGGRFACKIYFKNHVQGRPPFAMNSKTFEDSNPHKLEKYFARMKGLVSGERSKKNGENWRGTINWAAIYENNHSKIAEFKDWDHDGRMYWKDLV